VGDVARTRAMRNAYKILVGNLKGTTTWKTYAWFIGWALKK